MSCRPNTVASGIRARCCPVSQDAAARQQCQWKHVCFIWQTWAAANGLGMPKQRHFAEVIAVICIQKDGRRSCRCGCSLNLHNIVDCQKSSWSPNYWCGGLSISTKPVLPCLSQDPTQPCMQTCAQIYTHSSKAKGIVLLERISLSLAYSCQPAWIGCFQ